MSSSSFFLTSTQNHAFLKSDNCAVYTYLTRGAHGRTIHPSRLRKKLLP